MLNLLMKLKHLVLLTFFFLMLGCETIKKKTDEVAKKENELLGYSSQDIDLHLLKIGTTPIYFAIMVIISSIIMLSIRKNKPYIFHVLLGITLSVIIYYINNVFNIFGLTNKIPIYLSVFFPIIFLSIISIIGLVRINEQ